MFEPSLFCDHSKHVRRVAGAWVIDSHGTGTWLQRRAANGVSQVVWRCETCFEVTEPVPHRIVSVAVGRVDQLPMLTDYLGANPKCQVTDCERRDTELNHTYPRAVDPDKAERYPQVWLCRTHHEEWGHDVTPHLNPPRRAA